MFMFFSSLEDYNGGMVMGLFNQTHLLVRAQRFLESLLCLPPLTCAKLTRLETEDWTEQKWRWKFDLYELVEACEDWDWYFTNQAELKQHFFGCDEIVWWNSQGQRHKSQFRLCIFWTFHQTAWERNQIVGWSNQFVWIEPTLKWRFPQSWGYPGYHHPSQS